MAGLARKRQHRLHTSVERELYKEFFLLQMPIFLSLFLFFLSFLLLSLSLSFSHAVSCSPSKGKGQEGWNGKGGVSVPMLHRHPEWETEKRHTFGKRKLRVISHWKPAENFYRTCTHTKGGHLSNQSPKPHAPLPDPISLTRSERDRWRSNQTGLVAQSNRGRHQPSTKGSREGLVALRRVLILSRESNISRLKRG